LYLFALIIKVAGAVVGAFLFFSIDAAGFAPILSGWPVPGHVMIAGFVQYPEPTP
jgi:hypothetical protein